MQRFHEEQRLSARSKGGRLSPLDLRTGLSGKAKTRKHKQIWGIVPGTGWVAKSCLCVFFLGGGGHSLWGRKHT